MNHRLRFPLPRREEIEERGHIMNHPLPDHLPSRERVFLPHRPEKLRLKG
jgi:hypothetical protein